MNQLHKHNYIFKIIFNYKNNKINYKKLLIVIIFAANNKKKNMNYTLKTAVLASLASLTIVSCNNDQNSNDIQPIEQVQLGEANAAILAGIEITELSTEALNNLENELSGEARALQTEFFTLLEETNNRATIRTGRNFVRTQRGLISVTREFIRRARIASDQGEISTRRRTIELQRDLLNEISAELEFVEEASNSIDVSTLSLEALTDLESELSAEARAFQTEFFGGSEDRAIIRAGRNFLASQRQLIEVTREFIRRARVASNQGEISTRVRIIELQRDLLREIRTELDFVLNN